jgi:hypothetical protein
MKDEFKERAEDVARRWKTRRPMVLQGECGEAAGLSLALDALVEAMPDAKEQMLEELDAFFEGKGMNCIRNGDEIRTDDDKKYWAVPETHELIRLRKAYDVYRDSIEASQPTPDPRDELCEAAVAYVDDPHISQGGAAKFVNLERAVEAYKKGK